MPIDSHIHLYPESVYKNASKWAEHRGEAYWLSCVNPTSGKSLQAWKSVDQLLADMDTAEIEKAIILAWYWENHDTCRENFEWQKQWVNSHPDRLLAFAPFNAKGESDAIELLKEAFDLGFKGFGEINPPAQGYPYNSQVLHQALELASKYDLSVNFHVTDPHTHDYPGKIETSFADMVTLARIFPRVNFILAHLGGMEPTRFNQSIPPNTYYDTAATPLLYRDKTAYQGFRDKVPVDRILFGTDYPLRVFPSNPESPNFATALQHLANGSFSGSDYEAISSSNAKRLFNLP